MISNDIQGIGMTSQRTRDRLVDRLRDKGIKNESVLEVIRTTPRHIFVDEAMAHRAYEDTALPIGHGQTISQPYIVARMSEILLEGGTPDVVLEVGTGSGYQSAILSRLVPKVYTVERISALLQKARDAHRKMGLMNVFSKHSDGSWGWEPNAPYAAIMVTAAPKTVPPSLLQQLAVGGRMVIPVGSSGGVQELKLYLRTADGIEESTLEIVNFVPLLDGAVR
ncbi:MAG: protein-L-isoaspartate(D-aspartate) O-methyltransferase [Gammaproteobacteria bacterium]|nr:protein-L-isoaspartate(D-aspartate) O-methyltransferase [Gammaproteobacteria bacterium]MBT8134288.1 protein-L-isoaspartate(D-aspartate) O-methyltransferase [Gammaproteobacteria bacterium]NNJ49230.1 protein-L-isoaspartate(D-aspartate) O-methyltransferase [Gammaproteobacteria bacterium]